MKPVTVLFRYDDFSELSPMQLDEQLIGVFRDHGVPCTFAVIPAVTTGNFRDKDAREVRPLGSAKLALLQRAVADGVVDVALHGLHHRTVHPQPPHSEFAGLSVVEQSEKIRQGKELLEAALQTRIETFVPPWNTYDRDTLQALRQAQIRGISANRYSAVVEDEQIRYLPITIETHDLRRAVAQARRAGDGEAVIGVLLHPYDFRESGDQRGAMTLAQFAQEVRWLVEQPDVRVVSVSQLIREQQGLDHERFRANRPSPLENVYPPGVTRTVDTPLYFSTGRARRERTSKTSVTLIFFATLALAGYAAGRWGLGLVDPAWVHGTVATTARYAPLLLLLAVVARAIRAREVYFRALAVMCALGGVSAALMVV